MKIKIIGVPPGDAPEWVRKEWVGLILQVAEDVPQKGVVEKGVLGGPPTNVGGYPVSTKEAVEMLREKSQKAARWWDENVFPELMPWLVFKKEVCKVI